MASKQSVSTKTSAVKAATGAAPARTKPVRAAKSKSAKAAEVAVVPTVVEENIPAAAPRVKSARHSKPSISSEIATPVEAAPVEPTVSAVVAEVTEVSPHEAISKIAYGHWVARGYRHGNQHEDWLNAEREYLNRF